VIVTPGIVLFFRPWIATQRRNIDVHDFDLLNEVEPSLVYLNIVSIRRLQGLL